jgi:uncharacterized membrane protein YjjP (DUF1212 family)
MLAQLGQHNSTTIYMLAGISVACSIQEMLTHKMAAGASKDFNKKSYTAL